MYILLWQVPHPVVSVHNDGFMEYNKWYDMILYYTILYIYIYIWQILPITAIVVTHKLPLLRETKDKSMSSSERIKIWQRNGSIDWNRVLFGQADGRKFETAEGLCLLGSLLVDGGAKLQWGMFPHSCRTVCCRRWKIYSEHREQWGSPGSHPSLFVHC